jgi:hypothetical protein
MNVPPTNRTECCGAFSRPRCSPMSQPSLCCTLAHSSETVRSGREVAPSYTGDGACHSGPPGRTASAPRPGAFRVRLRTPPRRIGRPTPRDTRSRPRPRGVTACLSARGGRAHTFSALLRAGGLDCHAVPDLRAIEALAAEKLL